MRFSLVVALACLASLASSTLVDISVVEDAKEAPVEAIKALDALEAVWNCRDTAWKAVGLPLRRLARCGSPHNATDGDVSVINAHLGPIGTVLDLRTPEEVALDDGRRFPGALRKHVALGDRRIMALQIMRRASLKDVSNFLYLRLFQGRPEANLYMGQLIGGLSGLNEIILAEESEGINEALRIIASSPPPVLVHCTAGKDRTGLVVALALAVAGVPEHTIVEEYHQSHRHRDVIRDRAMRGVMKHSNDDDWSGAPKMVMERTFAFIRKSYGGVPQYLDAIGFSLVWQERLRTVLVGSGESFGFLL